MQEKYIISQNGYEIGPFTAHEILNKITTKALEPVDYVYIEEYNDWIMLAEFQAYLEKTTPLSASIPDQPPALTPYPMISDEKKEHLKKEALQEIAELKKKTQNIKLQQGQGLYSLPVEHAGQLLLKLKTTQPHLKTGAALEVKVKSNKPEYIDILGPSLITVGEEAVYVFVAKDRFGNVVTPYSGELDLKWSGKIEAPTKVKFNSGRGEISFTTTLAQKIQFEVLSSKDTPALNIPKATLLEFEAGPAEKLVLEGPAEAMAGEPIQVKVKALDKYGNLAKLDAEVEVEVSNQTA